MSKSRRQLDLRIEVQTPENIEFQYRVAGPFRRLPSYLIDVAIRGSLCLAVGLLATFAFGQVGYAGMGLGLGLAFWFVMSWFYGGLFETARNGQTPGKRMMGLRVVSIDGRPINGVQAVLRNILRAADSLPLVPLPGMDSPIPVLPLYLTGLVTPLFNRHYQRLGDLVGGTMVVVEEQQVAGALAMTDLDAIQLAAELPPNLHIGRSLAQAVAKYVARRSAFSRERRAEIAARLGETLAERYNLPRQLSYDGLLCALYYRAFIADRADPSAELPRERPLPSVAAGRSPA